MKLALLTASFATAAVASAAELKDPALVAQEWSRAIASAPEIKAPALSLRDQTPPPPAFPEKSFQQAPLWNPQFAPKSAPAPWDGIIRPEGGDKRPRGSKPYDFEGQTYWLIPITS